MPLPGTKGGVEVVDHEVGPIDDEWVDLLDAWDGGDVAYRALGDHAPASLHRDVGTHAVGVSCQIGAERGANRWYQDPGGEAGGEDTDYDN